MVKDAALIGAAVSKGAIVTVPPGESVALWPVSHDSLSFSPALNEPTRPDPPMASKSSPYSALTQLAGAPSATGPPVAEALQDSVLACSRP